MGQNLKIAEEDFVNLAYKIHKNVEAEIKLKVKEKNLSRTELEILLSIDELPKPTTPSEIAKHADIKLPLVSRILDSLVKRSILNSSRGSVDRRQNFIQLTPDGEALIASCKEVVRKLPVSLLSSLSDTEKMVIAAFLNSFAEIDCSSFKKTLKNFD